MTYGSGGVFVVLEDTMHGSFEVLARAASIWAGEALLDLFARSQSVPHSVNYYGRF